MLLQGCQLRRQFILLFCLELLKLCFEGVDCFCILLFSLGLNELELLLVGLGEFFEEEGFDLIAELLFDLSGARVTSGRNYLKRSRVSSLELLNRK